MILLAACGSGSAQEGSFRVGEAADCDTETIGNAVIESVADLDGLVTTTRIVGDLRLADLTTADLSQLSCLTEVTGTVTIASVSGLLDLNGLAALQTAGGLQITRNPDLQSLDGLEGLIAIDGGQVDDIGDVWITENDHLGDIEALGGLAQVTLDSIVVASNPSLVSLAGLQGVAETLTECIVADNDSLSSLDLNALVQTRTLRIANNEALTSLAGLSSLQRLERIEIEGNASLESLEGLTSLTEISGDETAIVVFGNPALAEIESLASAQMLRGRIAARENMSLSEEAFASFLEQIQDAGFEGDLIQDVF